MSNFSETYFYSSVLDNGELNEYGCGVKNINDTKEYYIYDADSKSYTTVDKEQYINYNEKMEKLHDTPPPPISTPAPSQPETKCPLTQQQQFKQRPVQSPPPPEECPCYTPPLTKKCPLTSQEQLPFTKKCPLTQQQQQQFKQGAERPSLFEECLCSSPPPSQCCQQLFRSPPPQCCQQPLFRPPRPQMQYPLGGFVKRIPVMNEVDVLKQENRKLRNMLKYYDASF